MFQSDIVGGSIGIKAGLLATSAHDVIEIGPDGLGYKCQITDYAATANANTTIVSGVGQNTNQGSINMRGAVVQDNNGYLYNSNGDSVTKWYANGNPVIRTVPTAGGSNMQLGVLLYLPNGNICFLYTVSTSNLLNFIIYDMNLNPIVSDTLIETVHDASVPFGAILLSGGGFAVIYQQNANSALSRYASYDNSGAPIVAAKTINTWTGTPGFVAQNMKQLSNGNIGVTANSAYTTTIGVYYAVIDTSGNSVKAFTQLSNVNFYNSSVTTAPEIDALPGFFSTCLCDGTNQKAWVFSNAGNIQGSPFSAADVYVAAGISNKIVNDGTTFYNIHGLSAADGIYITALPTTGTGYVTYTATMQNVGHSPNLVLDAFYERGNIVTFVGNNTFINVWNVALKSTTTDHQVVGFAVLNPTAIPGGDYTCIMDGSVSGASVTLGVIKYANTSVLGWARNAATAGSPISLAPLVGAYTANHMGGSFTKTFNHQGSNIPGNKGMLSTYGVNLDGLV